MAEFKKYEDEYPGISQNPYAPCCPLNVVYYEAFVEETDQGDILLAFDDKYAAKKGVKREYICCKYPREDWRLPTIKRDDAGGMQSVIKGESLKERYDFLLEMPYKYRQALTRLLDTSWQEYKKSLKAFGQHKKQGGDSPVFRGKPKYKRRGRDKINTLIYDNAKPDKYGVGRVCPDLNQEDYLLGMPGLKALYTPSLSTRLRDRKGRIPIVSVAKICKRADGYFLQLTIEDEVKPVRESKLACGIDVGLKYLAATDDPNKSPITSPRYLRQSERLLKQVQKSCDRKRSKALLKACQTLTLEEMLTRCPKLGEDRAKAIAMVRPKTHDELIQAILSVNKPAKSEAGHKQQVRRANQLVSLLKWRLVDPSKRLQRETKRLTRTHEKIRLQRRNFNHKISTFLVRTYGAIVVEDIQLTNLIRKNKPKQDEQGNYLKNNQKAKRGMNKSFSDAGIGQFLTMLEQKCQLYGREFVKVSPQYTTQDCPQCGTRVKMALSQRTRKCECGWIADRDVSAAINIRKKAKLKGDYLPSKGLS